MSDMLNSTLTFSHTLETVLNAIRSELGLVSLTLITDRQELDVYPSVRYAEIGGSVDGQQYTIVRLNLKTDSDQDWIGRQILAKLLNKLGLVSEQAEFQSYLPESDYVQTSVSPPLTGDHFRVTPHSGSLWQQVSDNPEVFHISITLRVYHD